MDNLLKTTAIGHYLLTLYRDLDILQLEMDRLIDEDPLSPEVQNYDSGIQLVKEEIEEVVRHNPPLH